MARAWLSPTGSDAEGDGPQDAPALDSGASNEDRILAIFKQHLSTAENRESTSARGTDRSLTIFTIMTGVLIGAMVGVIALWSGGYYSASGVSLILVAVAGELSYVGWKVHDEHVRASAAFRVKLESEVNSQATKSHHETARNANAEQWAAFLQARLDTGSSWLQTIVALAGLVPAAALVQSLPPFHLHPSVFTAISAGVVAGVITGWAYLAVRSTLAEREHLLLLSVLVLGGFLKRDKDIATAYIWVSSAESSDVNTG